MYNSPPRHSDTHYRAHTTHQHHANAPKGALSLSLTSSAGTARPLSVSRHITSRATPSSRQGTSRYRETRTEKARGAAGAAALRRTSAETGVQRGTEQPTGRGRTVGRRAAAERSAGDSTGRGHGRVAKQSAGGQHKGTQIHRHGRPGRAVGCSGRRASDTRTHHNHTRRHLERGQAGLEQPATPRVRLSPRRRPLWSLSRQHRETAPLTASPEAQRCTTTRDRRPGSLRWAVRGQLTERHTHTVSPMAGALPSTLAPQHLSRPAASATRVHKLFSQ